jgi:hypothetical protein
MSIAKETVIYLTVSFSFLNEVEWLLTGPVF